MSLVVDFAAMDIGSTTPDFAAMRAAGASVVIMRRFVCYFDLKYRAWRLSADPTFSRHAAAARSAGLVVGAYDFPGLGHGAPTALEQTSAAHAAGDLVRGIDLPPILDVEFPGRGITDTGLTAGEVATVLADHIEARNALYGCETGVYTSHVQMHDDNGLNGHSVASGGGTWCWLKTPYRQPAGAVPDHSAAVAPHFGAASWDPHDYWRVPDDWAQRGWWLQQTQGDAVGFPGVRQCDLGAWNALSDKQDVRWAWVERRLGGVPINAWQAAHGLEPDGIVGPRTFAKLAWQPAS